MDPIFLAELVIVAVIIAVQFIVFFRNNQSINSLADLYPGPSQLKTKPIAAESGSQTGSIDLIAENPRFSSTFQEIVRTTNAYLTKNRGAADFDILKEIAERRSHSQERAIEGNITLPLYIGLLCTFTGVIIGLVKIATEGVSDPAIQSFIGGVLIGMVGSAMGLSLTVRSNYSFKNSKQERDNEEYNYFTFLRTNILPALRRDPSQPVSALRENLAAFNEGFAQYQEQVNGSLNESLQLFSDLKGVFTQIRGLEQGLTGIGHFLQANDGMIDKQIAYLDSYSQKAEAFTQKLGSHFQQTDRQVSALVDENIRALDSSTKAAFVKMDQYLSTLDGGDSKAFVEAINRDLDKIRGNVATLQEKSIEVNARLLEQLNRDTESRDELAEQVRIMNAKLEQSLAHPGGFMNSMAFQFFVYAGAAAFVLSIIGGAVFLANSF